MLPKITKNVTSSQQYTQHVQAKQLDNNVDTSRVRDV